MSKHLLDLRIASSRILPGGCSIIELELPDRSSLPPVHPGQFAEIKIDNSPNTMLRRPISVCDITDNGRRLVLLVKPVGDGSRHLVDSPVGSVVNVLMPLGNGFTMPEAPCRTLLVGGGVGSAPIVMLAHALTAAGCDVTVALGGRTSADLEGIKDLYGTARVVFSTDDGSAGHHGLVTTLPEFAEDYDRIYCCGPTPMMRAVAKIARQRDICCEVSLENMMACGLGACLCCVEKTIKGNTCVCTDGPVFNIDMLTWQ
ncbi:MAG: dihydroorotate dehydrogenase electron transfer subunit [Bacteroidales bacterium]|nr:dihydroorotate dehydrogenase electron transfer subunit [Bacteroidales bacterium]